MKLNLILFLYIICSYYSSNGIAQDYLFDVEVIGVEDGLPEREVYNIVEDKKGYLWISTQGAISRYDGKQFKTYSAKALNIGEYNYTNLTEDDENNVWYVERTDLEKNSGVIDPIKDSIFTIEQYTNNLFQAKEVLNLNYAYQDPSCWFLTTREGVMYNYKNGNFQKVYDIVRDKIPGLPHFELNSDKGENWVLQGKRAIRLEGETPIDTFIIDKPDLNFWRVLQQKPALVIESFSSKSGQEYWEFKDNQLVPYQTSDKLSFDHILLLEKDFKVFTVGDTLIIRDNNQQLLLKQKNPLGKNVEKGLYLKNRMSYSYNLPMKF